MKEKIIFITKALWFGGIETALVNLLGHFDYDRYDVTLLVLQADLDMLDRVPDRCRVLIIDRDHRAGNDRPYPYSRLFHMTEKTGHYSALHRKMMWTVPAIRAIENRLFIGHVKKTLAKEHFKTAVIYSDIVGEIAVRSIRADRFLMYYHHGAMRRVWHDEIAYKKADRIIAVSENQARSLREFLPKYAGKICVIHNLADIEGIRQMGNEEAEDRFDRNKLNIVSVGRVSPEKGMDLAVRTCSRLVKDGFHDLQWWIVGGGPASKEVRELIRQTGMNDYVRMTGMKANPFPYIRLADLYVQPSRFEGYPMTVLEALVLGQPVISTDNPGAAEIIEDQRTGLLCPIDIEAIAESIEELFRNPGRLAAMRQHVEELDFERQNQECLRRLEELL